MLTRTTTAGTGDYYGACYGRPDDPRTDDLPDWRDEVRDMSIVIKETLRMIDAEVEKPFPSTERISQWRNEIAQFAMEP